MKNNNCSECVVLYVLMAVTVIGIIIVFNFRDIKNYFFPLEKVYLVEEIENCKKAGGIFSYDDFLMNLYYKAQITCKKTTNEGNKTITEDIFDYKIAR